MRTVTLLSGRQLDQVSQSGMLLGDKEGQDGTLNAPPSVRLMVQKYYLINASTLI